MRTPECPQHPGGRVWRDGRYGKNGQYPRWPCVPPVGTRRNSRLFQPTPLPRKAVGGGSMECERSWSPWDGLPSARTDRFSLRETAEALVQMAHVLHDRHLGYQGAPPPRRLVDMPELNPGLRGGRQRAPQD
jgi:hypothetical protein